MLKSPLLFMPRALLSSAAVLAFSGPVFAQNPPDTVEKGNAASKGVKIVRKDPAVSKGDLRSADTTQTLRHLRDALKLSGSQQDRAADLLDYRNSRLQQLDPALSPEERTVQTEAIYRFTEQQLMAMLSSKQLLDYKLHYSEETPGEPKRLRKLATINASFAYTTTPDALKQWQQFVPLTEAQQTELKPLLNAQLRQLHAARRLDPSAEKSIREQAAMVRAERRIDALLTPEQRARVENLLLLPTPSNPVPAIVITPRQSSR